MRCDCSHELEAHVGKCDNCKCPRFNPSEVKPTAAAIMAAANNLVNGPRQADYGTPEQNFGGVANIWTGLLTAKLSSPITATEVALMMVGLKLARETSRAKLDNVVDGHGYLVIAGRLAGHTEK